MNGDGAVGYHLAIGLGAGSGRTILVRVDIDERGQLLEEQEGACRTT